MDFIPGIDGPNEGVPRVLACFSNNLLRGEPLKLVDGGQSQRTFIFIKDAIEAVLLMIENPDRANGHIFNVGNPNNEVTVRQLAEMMTQVYSKVSGESPPEVSTIDVSSQEFYGMGYDDCNKRIPDMTIINKQLGIFSSPFPPYFSTYKIKPVFAEQKNRHACLEPEDFALGLARIYPHISTQDLLRSCHTRHCKARRNELKNSLDDSNDSFPKSKKKSQCLILVKIPNSKFCRLSSCLDVISVAIILM